MVIDCVQCLVRGAACAGCAVTFVTETGPGEAPAAAGRPGAELDADEMRALAALANAGMIPPLRFVPPMAKAS